MSALPRQPSSASRRGSSSAPFERTTANTMGFAEGDTDYDGRFEIIGIDMKPYQEDPVWTPPLEGNGSMLGHGRLL